MVDGGAVEQGTGLKLGLEKGGFQETPFDLAMGEVGGLLSVLNDRLKVVKPWLDRLPRNAQEVAYLRAVGLRAHEGELALARCECSMRMQVGVAQKREVMSLYPDIGRRIWGIYGKDPNKGAFLVGPQYGSVGEFLAIGEFYDISPVVADAVLINGLPSGDRDMRDLLYLAGESGNLAIVYLRNARDIDRDITPSVLNKLLSKYKAEVLENVVLVKNIDRRSLEEMCNQLSGLSSEVLGKLRECGGIFDKHEIGVIVKNPDIFLRLINEGVEVEDVVEGISLGLLTVGDLKQERQNTELPYFIDDVVDVLNGLAFDGALKRYESLDQALSRIDLGEKRDFVVQDGMAYICDGDRIDCCGKMINGLHGRLLAGAFEKEGMDVDFFVNKEEEGRVKTEMVLADGCRLVQVFEKCNVKESEKLEKVLSSDSDIARVVELLIVDSDGVAWSLLNEDVGESLVEVADSWDYKGERIKRRQGNTDDLIFNDDGSVGGAIVVRLITEVESLATLLHEKGHLRFFESLRNRLSAQAYKDYDDMLRSRGTTRRFGFETAYAIMLNELGASLAGAQLISSVLGDSAIGIELQLATKKIADRYKNAFEVGHGIDFTGTILEG